MRKLNKWSEEEIRLLRELHSKGLTNKEISAYFDKRNPDDVKSKIGKLGLKSNRDKKEWTKEDFLILEDMYKNNISIDEIAKKLNTTMSGVNNMIYLHEINKKYPECRKENVVGLKFNSLTITEELGIFAKDGNIGRHHYVKCLCEDCGKYSIKILDNLKNKEEETCECHKKPHSAFKDMTGEVHGHLTVVKRVEDYITPKGTRKVRYLCRCDCENKTEVVVWASNLRHGNKTVSCGCVQKEVGRIAGIASKKYNDAYIYNDIVFVKFTNCDEYFICDLEDWDYLKYFTWSKNAGFEGYAYTVIDGKTYLMHKLIINNCPKDHYIDHEFQVINGVCDNRKLNLRIANRRQNAMNHILFKTNTSGYSGVKQRGKAWEVTINVISNKQTVICGFENKEDAIRKRLQLEHDYYNIFSPQRFLFKKWNIDDSDLDYESVRFDKIEVQKKYGYKPYLTNKKLISKVEEIKKYSKQPN